MSATAQPSSRVDSSSQRGRLRSGLASAAVLSILLGGLVLAIPGLGAVGHRLAHASWGWVFLGGGLEVASCIGYVLAFQGIFDHVPARFAMLVASAEQAFGAVVPVGGAGGIAAGGWLLSRAGMPVRVIAERSAILFLLTSAGNVVTLVLTGAGLAIGVFAGPRNLALSALPAGVGLAVLLVFLVPALRTSGTPGGATLSLPARALRATAAATATTLRAMQRPGWRLAVGTCAYLLCDTAVLWLTIHAMGYNAPIAPLLLAYLIGYLANAIPVPGGLGVLDGGLAGALILYHIPTSVALGGVLLYHALALWIPALSGTAGFLAAQRQLGSGGVRVERDRPITSCPARSAVARTRSRSHRSRV
ncbi:MAG TPA: lysylphosphatidylglycerol synthase domain-containing protein [Candidatus Dormibacteraeota bacterium]|nr:lysylphosphatidylglycerol synthase domain-containing protein [Candidatus Dormibacteraeota bacterium]